MKTPFLLVALILAQGMAQGSAQAGSISIDIDGKTIHIAAPRGCADTSCLSISMKGLTTAHSQSDTIDLADLVSKFMPKSDAIDAQAAPISDVPTITPRPTPDPKIAKLEEQPAETTPAFDPASPIGFWETERREGIVHIVACSDKLCGYKFDPTTKADGVQILIDMKPVDTTKWGGTIHDPVKGGTYSSTLALKGPKSLRVEGCAFGGMICGGQTWSRL